MDIDDDEHEELRRLDQSRSDNWVLNAWLTVQHSEFPDWAERVPVRGTSVSARSSPSKT
ncbi:hypothetical protein [Streptomyces chryseus]